MVTVVVVVVSEVFVSIRLFLMKYIVENVSTIEM